MNQTSPFLSIVCAKHLFNWLIHAECSNVKYISQNQELNDNPKGMRSCPSCEWKYKKLLEELEANDI